MQSSSSTVVKEGITDETLSENTQAYPRQEPGRSAGMPSDRSEGGSSVRKKIRLRAKSVQCPRMRVAQLAVSHFSSVSSVMVLDLETKKVMDPFPRVRICCL